MPSDRNVYQVSFMSIPLHTCDVSEITLQELDSEHKYIPNEFHLLILE